VDAVQQGDRETLRAERLDQLRALFGTD